jgi:multidrug efflux pump subunit AcrA (membrane-fusion protein)
MKSFTLLTRLAILSAAIYGTVDCSAAEYQLRGAFVKLKKDIDVPAQSSGVIKNLKIHKGSIVGPESVMGTLDDTEAIANVSFAQAQLDSAKLQATIDVGVQVAIAGAKAAQAEYDAMLFANRRTPGAFSAADVRRAKFQAERAKLQVENEQFNMKIAGFDVGTRTAQLSVSIDQLKRRQITAPLDGVVVEIARHPGEYVREGETILRVVQMDVLTVSGFLNVKTDGRPPLMNRAVTIMVESDKGKSATLEGRVIFVSPVPLLDGDYRVEAEFENSFDNGIWLMQPEQPATVTVLNRIAPKQVSQLPNR